MYGKFISQNFYTVGIYLVRNSVRSALLIIPSLYNIQNSPHEVAKLSVGDQGEVRHLLVSMMNNEQSCQHAVCALGDGCMYGLPSPVLSLT
jgi:hypothetical protein